MKKLIIAAGMLVFGLSAMANNGEKELSLRYQENKGQVIDTDGNLRPDILFTAESGGVKAYLRETGISYVFAQFDILSLELEASAEDRQSFYDRSREQNTVSYHRVDLDFVGANVNCNVIQADPYEAVSNYFLPHADGLENIQSFKTVVYQDLYPNIDLKFYTSSGNLKYDFIVHPGGDPSDIKIDLSGMDNAEIDEMGQLVLQTSKGVIIEEAPYTFQSNGHVVSSAFELNENQVAFQLGSYDIQSDLTIDPTWLWSTYFGGSSDEYYPQTATDGSGNVFNSSMTYSSNFPVTAGAFDETYTYADQTLAMFDSDGILLWATYFGGSDYDWPGGIDVDDAGDIVVVGFNYHNGTFPTTAGAYGDGTSTFSYDHTIAKFDNSGALSWAGIIGGGDNYECKVGTDSNNDVLVVGRGFNNGFPTTAGAFDETWNGGYDYVVFKLSDDGSTLIWSTFIGGSGYEEYIPDIAVDSNDDLIIIGGGYNGNINFWPTTTGAFDETFNGGTEVVMAKFLSDGTLDWSTFLGGTSDEGNWSYRMNVTTDASDNIYPAFCAYGNDLPTTPGTFDPVGTINNWDMYLAQFDPTGGFNWGTFVSSTDTEIPNGISAANGKIYISGASNGGSFPVTGDAHQASFGGSWDYTICEFDNTGNMTYGTYYGGTEYVEPVYGDCSYGSGQLNLTGISNASGYPVSTGAFDETHNGGYDIVLTTFRFCDIQLTVDAAIDVLCNGETTGSIDLTTTTTTESPVTYLWTGGATTEDISGLPAGDYDLVATGGATGCTVDLQTITIAEPDTMSATLTGVDPLCFGLSTGTIDLTPGGGVPAYTFAWTGGSTSEDPSSLAGGMYVVTITDDNGCVFEDSLMINEPTDIDAAFIITDVLCNGGADGDIDMTTSGGTPGYTYDWNTSETTEDITGLVAGDYTVLITDANGCIAFKGTTVGEPDEILLDLHTTDVACHGDSTGAIDLTVIGGTPTFTYTWDNGETTEDLADLTAGWYIIDLVDANGCTAMDSAEVMQADTLELTAAIVMETSGSDGEIHLFVVGGTAPYTYDWDNGATNTDLFGLVAGDYTVTVTDANGCIVMMTFTVTSQVGIETSSINGLDVYPNPFNESFNINYNGNYDYSIYDAAGKLIQVGNGNGQSVIDLDEVEAGMYILQIATSTGMDNIQLIKQ